MEPKIEKNVPIRKSKQSRSGITTALRKMVIGDSFLMPAKNRGIYSQAKLAKVKVHCSMEDNDQVRVWRIK